MHGTHGDLFELSNLQCDMAYCDYYLHQVFEKNFLRTKISIHWRISSAMFEEKTVMAKIYVPFTA